MKTAWIALSVATLAPLSMLGQGTAFTYQGLLDNNGAPANGLYDFRFRLSEDAFGDTYFGTPYTTTLGVTNGLFTTTIDFGLGSFTGSNYWLEIDVRSNNVGGYNLLSPLQPFTSAPYARFADAASNLLGTLSASQLTGSVQNSSLSGTYGSVVTFNNAGNSFSGVFSGNGAGLTNLQSWGLTGNSGTTPGVNFLGTSDNQPLELHADGLRAMRFEPGGVSAYAASLGFSNLTGSPNVIGGAPVNFVVPGVVGAFIGGGGTTNYGELASTNSVAADFGVIAGGVGNEVGYLALESFIGGGLQNTIGGSNVMSVIVGGANNQIQGSGYYSAIGGGYGNTIQENCSSSVIFGGQDCEIKSNTPCGTIAGGDMNDIDGNCSHATIAGGDANEIDAYCTNGTIAGGRVNGLAAGVLDGTIGGGENNYVTGNYGTIPGGNDNTAAAYAFAVGYQASATDAGSFVWADGSGAGGYFYSKTTNEFAARATGGVRFTTGNTGADQTVSWTPGAGSWSFTSDRNTKDHVQPVNSRDILEKLAHVPINEWQYIGYGQRHIGPMAQDFHKEFPLNENDKTLNETDLHGVALAAIQGLNAKLEDEITRNRQKDQEIDALRRQVQDLTDLIKKSGK